MSRQFLTRMAIALAALVFLLGVFAAVRRLGQDHAVALALPRIDTAAVDTVSIARGGNSLVIARGADSTWSVNGFPAAEEAISGLLTGLADSSRSTELVAQSKASHARLHVDADSGHRVRVVSRDHTLLDLYAGDRTSDYSGGLLIRQPTADKVYSLRGPLAEALTRVPDDWRDKRIVTTNPDSIGTVEVRRGSRTFSLLRSDKGWRFASGAATDSSAVASLVSGYREIRAAGFASKAQEDSADFRRGDGRLRLVSRSGAPVANLIIDSTASGIWVRADPSGVVYRIESWTWNQIAPAESTLRAKKK